MPAELLDRRTAIYLLELDTVKRVTLLLLVAALGASSLSTLHCEWVCVEAQKAESANGHCHDDGTRHGARLSAEAHACDHAPATLVALKGPGAPNQTVVSPVLAAFSIPPRFAAAIPQLAANDAGPPGLRPVVSPGSILPLRI